MLGGLRRYNSIGDKGGIYKFAQAVFSNGKTDEKTVYALCGFRDDSYVHVKAGLAVFVYLGLIKVVGTRITPTREGLGIFPGVLPLVFLDSLASICLSKVISNGVVDIGAVHYEELDGYFYIDRAGFPLCAAIFRNLLLELGALSLDLSGNYRVLGRFEAVFIPQVKEVRKKIAEKQLQEQLELLRLQGMEGEQFALQYEKKRLGGHPFISKIQLVSDIDVAAGYDIISYEGGGSVKYDRFIEVKTFKNNPHFFWSENEVAQAKLKANHYYIYLVDIEKITLEGYVPVVICNPAKEILDNPAWLVSPASYAVRKVGFK